MPDPLGSIIRNPIAFLTSLAVASISVCPIFPTPGLSACVTCLLYFYLQHEHCFNSSLVRCTPSSPENPLPSHDEWIANGGLKKLPHEPSTSTDDECCIVCRDVPNDPTQITLCGHMFCTECLSAWHAQGERSCPQCTVILWRDVPADRSRLEKLVKITAAEGLVAGPLTAFALCVYFAYFFFGPAARIGVVQVLMLVSYVVFSGVGLLFVSQGWLLMVQRRRAQGLDWWGGDLDSVLDEAWRMSFHLFSIIAGLWLLAMSLTVEAYMGVVMPILRLKILGLSGDMAESAP